MTINFLKNYYINFLIIFLLCFASFDCKSNTNKFVEIYIIENDTIIHESEYTELILFKILGKKVKFYFNNNSEKKRGIAIALNIFTGIMGMHRVYLGTSTIVPAVYSITLGGGLGALTITDLFFLIFSKDISQFENNPKVFMWIK